jgi:hypothetical protein
VKSVADQFARVEPEQCGLVSLDPDAGGLSVGRDGYDPIAPIDQGGGEPRSETSPGPGDRRRGLRLLR